jgi:S-formylglutathione hydrolase FrmB
VWTTAAVSAPGLQYQTFASAAARATVSYHVFLPPAYAAEPQRRFPVLYWLHGSGPTRSVLDGIVLLTQRFQAAMNAGRVPPFIVVFAHGMEESLWVDSTDGRVPMETVVAGELVTHIDATLRTRAERAGRAVEGFSMGGYGAARFGLKFSDRFGAASILAAGPMQRTLSAAIGPPEKSDERERVLARVFGGSQQAFIDASPWELAGRNAQAVRASGLVVRLAIGAADSTLPANREFRQRLLDLNLPHEYSEWPGVGHSTLALLDAMGDGFWAFHRAAFAGPARP